MEQTRLEVAERPELGANASKAHARVLALAVALMETAQSGKALKINKTSQAIRVSRAAAHARTQGYMLHVRDADGGCIAWCERKTKTLNSAST